MQFLTNNPLHSPHSKGSRTGKLHIPSRCIASMAHLGAPQSVVFDLTKSLQCTFSFPVGTCFARPGLFDIRDEICLAAGGFRHGQVVEDNDGDRAVVVGVRCEEDWEATPNLWFKCDGNEGAGLYNDYHLVRKEFKVLGSRELQEVLPSDPMFQNQDPKKRGILQELLRGFHGLLEREHDLPMDEDFKFDYNYCYLEPAMFDIVASGTATWLNAQALHPHQWSLG